MRKCVLFILIALGLTIPGLGQTPTTSDAEKKDNIRKLMTITGVEKLVDSMLDQYLQAINTQLARGSENNEQKRKQLDRFSELLSTELKQTDLIGMYVDLYDKYFTNDEIKALIQFYESPVGKKAIQVLPALMQEAMQRGMRFGSTAGEKAIARMVEEFPELKSVLQETPQK